MANRCKSALVPELGCRDVLKNLLFYTEILGFDIRYERSEKGFYYLERQGAEIMIEQMCADSWVAAKAEPPFGQGMHFEICTDDLAALYDTCKTSNAVLFREWEEVWYRAENTYLGQVQFIVQDPDGYLLRFEQELGALTKPKTGRIVG